MPQTSRKTDTAPRQARPSPRQITRTRNPSQHTETLPAPAASASAPAVAGPETSSRTKCELIVGLLRSERGATLQDLVSATGWLAHTTRAALTRLRQAGHDIQRSQREGGSVYRIAPPAPARRVRKAV